MNNNKIFTIEYLKLNPHKAVFYSHMMAAQASGLLFI